MRAASRTRALLRASLCCLLWMGAGEDLAHAVGFTSLTPLPYGISGLSIVASNGHLYALSGQSSKRGIFDGDKVFFAKLNPDGTIGSWEPTTPLPVHSYFQDAVAVNGRIYHLGGWRFDPASSSFELSRKVHVAMINPDGSLGAWTETTSLPESIFSQGAVASGSKIYVAGGFTEKGFGWLENRARILAADVAPDGSLGPWRAETPDPPPPGLLAAMSSTFFMRAPVSDTGVFGAAITAAPKEGTVLMVGGYAKEAPSAEVYRATIQPDFLLSEWKATTPLPVPLYLHDALIVDATLYVAGGNDGRGPQPAVYALSLR